MLEQGKVIDIYTPEGKTYDRILVAAPITIGTTNYYMGVMVQRDHQSQRMYLHDVITEEKATNVVHNGVSTSEILRDTGHLFVTSILQNRIGVKRSQKKSFNISEKKIDSITAEDLQTLEKHFGTTNNFDVAGYLLTDGKMLDFSGKHWGDDYSTSRTVDHRDVLEGFNYEGVHDGNNGVKAMVDMIGSGNIRLAPESGGINIAIAPNDTQIWKLTEYIRHFRGEVVVDIDAVGGDTIHTFTYNKGTAPMAVIRDIMQYFEDGTVPQPQPDYRQFRYNIDTEAAEQAAREAENAAEPA